jgi:hypothetical protein
MGAGCKQLPEQLTLSRLIGRTDASGLLSSSQPSDVLDFMQSEVAATNGSISMSGAYSLNIGGEFCSVYEMGLSQGVAAAK